MTTPDSSLLREQKQNLRYQARVLRRKQRGKETLSRRICQRLNDLPEYGEARTLLFYVDARSEVRTQPFIPVALERGKRIAVPYCDGNHLRLFLLSRMNELEPGVLSILEPRVELREGRDQEIPIHEIDLVVVPGVAFDRRGGRLGHGKGYYDRLLVHARPETLLVGLAFECQLFDEIPMTEHDVFLDKVITEKTIYEGRRRGRSDP